MEHLSLSSLWGRRHRTVVAVTATALLSLIFAGRTLAADKMTSFTDISAGAWYESAAQDLIDLGALDNSQTRFRPNDMATRAEMVELLVRLRKEPLQSPARRSFDDVATSASYYEYIETAGRVGWLRGDKNCYGTHPCWARPNDGVNRAEAAALLMRVFALPHTGAAPVFSDNSNENAWFYMNIQTAADHCVLQGDDNTRLVRPAFGMNRAEMIAMFSRAAKNLTYGEDCGVSNPAPVKGDISSAVATSSTTVRLTFTADLDARANDEFRYTLNTVGGGRIAVTDAVLINSRTVDLTLATSLTNQSSYRANVIDLRTAAGVFFSAEETFLFSAQSAGISSAVATSATRVRVTFDADVQAVTADDAYRYTVRQASGSSVIGVDSAIIVDSHTVDLVLTSALQSQIPYLVNSNDLLTQSGVRFNDSATFRFGEMTPDLTNVSAVSATVLRLTFATELNESDAETVSKYRVTGNGRDLLVTNAHLINPRLVEITLGENMETQRSYTVRATDLRTAGNVLFTDSATLLYTGADTRFQATMIGAKEVPPVSVALSGTGSFTLSTSGLSYDITLQNLSGSVITGAHFHRGTTGNNGPVIQSITFTGTRATGTWTGLSEQDRNDLLAGSIYVNIHTQAYPDGAIRGQVVKL